MENKLKHNTPNKKGEEVQNSLKEMVGQSAERWLARNRSLVLRQTPLWAQSMVGIMIGLGVITVSAGVLFRIDEVVTLTGQLVAKNGSVEVKTPVGGKVAEVLFKDGEIVTKGQPLVKFDTRVAAAERETKSQLIQLEQTDLRDKLNMFKERKEVLAQKVRTSEKITSELAKLVETGAFQRVQYLQQLDQLYELRSQLTSTKLEISRSKLESEKSIRQLTNQLKQAELTLQYQNVKSPATGIVFQPKATVDGVLGAGETIVTIIPQQGLKVKVFVANKDIGFVKGGQQAQVRVDAFPFTRYGELNGVVTHIGADALPPDQTANYYRFPVILSLNKPYLKSKGIKIPLRSGMAITANLKLRDKRVISLVSDMLVDQTDSIRGIRQQ